MEQNIFWDEQHGGAKEGLSAHSKSSVQTHKNVSLKHLFDNSTVSFAIVCHPFERLVHCVSLQGQNWAGHLVFQNLCSRHFFASRLCLPDQVPPVCLLPPGHPREHLKVQFVMLIKLHCSVNVNLWELFSCQLFCATAKKRLECRSKLLNLVNLTYMYSRKGGIDKASNGNVFLFFILFLFSSFFSSIKIWHFDLIPLLFWLRQELKKRKCLYVPSLSRAVNHHLSRSDST